MTNFGPLGEEVYRRTYSRPIYDDNGLLLRHEEWLDTVERVVDGNLALDPSGGKHLWHTEREDLIEFISSMKLLPAGRHLWASGTRDSRGLFNCFRGGWGEDFSSHFTFMFDQLMLGGGVGTNYSSEYLESYKVLNNVSLVLICDYDHPDIEAMPSLVIPVAGPAPSFKGLYYRVEDSREGWVEALRMILEATQNINTTYVVLNLSDVRERGAPIKGFGGIASGPVPLAQMLLEVNDLLNNRVGESLSPIDAMDIDHAIASCVIAGNVRRSARMSILHWNDPHIFDFILCKDDPNKHWTTNISVEVDEGFFLELENGLGHTKANSVFDLVVARMYEHGEPGFFNSHYASLGEPDDVRSTNPCGEIALNDWEACCLGHVNLAAFNPNDITEITYAFELMARFLYRATFAPVTDENTASIEDKNHRIGVGILGFQEYCVNSGVRLSELASDSLWDTRGGSIANDLSYFRTVAEDSAYSYARALDTRVPVKTTTVAPTGTISMVAGVTPGIQAVFAKYFLRRVRYSNNDAAIVDIDNKRNPHHPDFVSEHYLPVGVATMEEDQYSAHTTVLAYISKDTILDRVNNPDLVESQDELTVYEQLGVQAFVQRYYANNAVSFTAGFDPATTSQEELAKAIKHWLPALKGTTAFPDISRPQSPIERISPEQYSQELFVNSLSIDGECASGACPIK